MNIDTRTVELNLKDTESIYTTVQDQLTQEPVVDNMFKHNENEWQPLEFDNIFHANGPKFMEDRLQTDLSNTDLVLISALANQLWNNRPDDEIREEMLRPYVLALTKHPDRNWLVCHTG